MATNNFLTFAPNANTAGGSNFLSQSAYAADDERYSGVLYGAEARSGLMNKALRQGVNMAAAHAQAVSDIASVDMLDDGTTTTLISNIKAAWTQSAVTAIAAAAGVSICPLVSGLVPAANLPSYVDDVLEYSSLSAFPTTGETGKIYVAIDTKLTYRWSGSAYIELSQDAITAQKWSTAKTLTVSGIVSGSVSSTWESGPTVSLDVVATDATLAGTEYFPLKQGSSFMRTTLDAIKTYVNSGIATTTQVGNYKAYTAISTSRALTVAESGTAFLVTGSPTITTPTAVASNLRYKLYAGSAFTLTAASGTFYGYIDADMTTSISVAAHQSIEIICDGGNWEVIGGLLAPNSAGVRAVTLTGLSTSSATAITATDTLLSAAGKLQAQITADTGSGFLGAPSDFTIYLSAASATLAFTLARFSVVNASTGAYLHEFATHSMGFTGSTTGANGMDTGTIPASSWVALYVIYNPTTATFALLGQQVAATTNADKYYSGSYMPSGYTYSALISYLQTNSSSQFIAFSQVGHKISVIGASWQFLSTTTTTSGLSVISNAVPATVRKVWAFCEIAASATTAIGYFAQDSLGMGLIDIRAYIAGAANFELPIAISRTIYYHLATGTSLNAYISSYEF